MHRDGEDEIQADKEWTVEIHSLGLRRYKYICIYYRGILLSLHYIYSQFPSGTSHTHTHAHKQYYVNLIYLYCIHCSL